MNGQLAVLARTRKELWSLFWLVRGPIHPPRRGGEKCRSKISGFGVRAPDGAQIGPPRRVRVVDRGLRVGGDVARYRPGSRFPVGQAGPERHRPAARCDDGGAVRPEALCVSRGGERPSSLGRRSGLMKLGAAGSGERRGGLQAAPTLVTDGRMVGPRPRSSRGRDDPPRGLGEQCLRDLSASTTLGRSRHSAGSRSVTTLDLRALLRRRTARPPQPQSGGSRE
jgi:hypothetical protein